MGMAAADQVWLEMSGRGWEIRVVRCSHDERNYAMQHSFHASGARRDRRKLGYETVSNVCYFS